MPRKEEQRLKAEQTSIVARQSLQAEAKAREAKTARLRRLREKREAANAGKPAKT
jgi:hypothetical protein